VAGGIGRRLRVAALAVGLVLPAVLLVSRAKGLPAERPRLTGGGAWLASPAQGLVTLIDGASEQVVGSVRAPGAVPGDDLSVVQAGSSAYVVNGSGGTVSRVDGGTYEASAPVRFGLPGGRLSVLAGGPGLYIVDGARRAVSVTDPVTLRVRQRLSLAARPGPDQSVVDDAGRLWLIDGAGGGLTWLDGAKRVRPDVGRPADRLVLVGGRPVLLDLTRPRVGRLDDDGAVRSWSCVDTQAGDQAQLLGSATGPWVWLAVPASGTLIGAAVGRDDCARTVDVGRPGDRFGALAESGGFVFVPDLTTGRTAVVDTAAGRVVADLAMARPGNRLELLAKDGLVFYNDLDGDRAGVIRFTGGRWRLGRSLRKYDPAGGAKILTAGGAGATAIQPPTPTPSSPRPGQPASPPSGPPPPDAGRPGAGRPGAGPSVPGGSNEPGGPGGSGGPSGPGRPGGNPGGGPGGAPVPVPLAVRVSGAGTVTAAQPAPLNAPAGARCAADCDWNYPAGTAVTLRLTPAAGAVLDHAAGCTSIAGTLCRLRLTAAATVQAVFVPAPPGTVTLTVNTTGPGTVTATSPAAGCTPTCAVTVPAGTTVRLAANPAAGGYLAGWGDAGCPVTASTCDIAVAVDRTVSVAFASLAVLTLTAGGHGTGSFTGTGLTCSAGTCTGSYPPGTALTVTAVADPTSKFAAWTGCPAATGATCQLTVSAATAVQASFDITMAAFAGTWVNTDTDPGTLYIRLTVQQTGPLTARLQRETCTLCFTSSTGSLSPSGVLESTFNNGLGRSDTIKLTRTGGQLTLDISRTDISGLPPRHFSYTLNPA